MIRDRDSFHTEGGRPFQETINPNRTVEETVLGVNM
jgi:hypothetical protein